MDNSKTRLIEILLNSSIILVNLNLVLASIGFYKYRTSPVILIGFTIMFITSMVVLIVNKKHLTNSYKIYIPLVLVGMIYIVNGFMYKTPTYILYGGVFAFQFPILYEVSKYIDFNRYIMIFAKSNIIFYFMIVLINMLLYPVTYMQYDGILNNPNHWGEWSVFVVLQLLYVLEKTYKNRNKYFYTLLIAVSVANIIMSQSRTTLLALIAICIVFIRYMYINKKLNLKKLFVVALIIAIIFPGIYLWQSKVTPIISTKVIEVENNISVEETDESISFSKAIDRTNDRYLKGINDGNSFSSGRFTIWKAYVEQISIKGHNPKPLIIANGENVREQNAHNAILQIGYEAGCIAMILFVFFMIRCGLYYLKKLFGKDITVEDGYNIASVAMAAIYMMLSSQFAPYLAFSMLSFWLFAHINYINRY